MPPWQDGGSAPPRAALATTGRALPASCRFRIVEDRRIKENQQTCSQRHSADPSRYGTRQIVIATDKPVSFAAAASDSQAMDYPFTLIEMRMKPNDKGEGKMLAETSITVENGRLELEDYSQEPVRLTSITEAERTQRSERVTTAPGFARFSLPEIRRARRDAATPALQVASGPLPRRSTTVASLDAAE